MNEISMMPIGDIIPYENNPRKNKDAVSKVAASLREFGFKQPIVVDKDMVVIAGHTRLQAAKKLKMKEVPVLVADDLTDEQAKAYRLADNKTAEFAEWDDVLLQDELADILDIDMEQFGFDIDLEDEEKENEAEIEEDEPEDDVPERCKRGDVWLLGEHRLICGDSTDVNIIGRLMDDIEPDLVLTDPPYGINVLHGDNRIGSEKGADSKGARVTSANVYHPFENDDTTETAQAAYDMLSQMCDRLIIFGGNYFLDFLPPSDGWLIWDKRCQDDMRNDFADGEMAWCSFHTPVRIYHQMWNGMIREGEHEKRVHPTQKPVRMLSDIIKDFSEEGDVILDVFGGSGSTLVACEQTGRRCFMAELSEHYCDVIINRWEQLTGQEAVRLVEDENDGKRIE